jgi:hypothetical protein
VKSLLVFCSLFLSLDASTQNTEVLRGRCINGSNQLAISGVSIFVSGLQNYQLFSDTTGYFYALVSPGIYRIIVEHKDFRTQLRENISIEAGKEEIQNFELTEFAVNLSPITVTPEKKREIEISPFKIQQYAAVFYDPARVLNSHAGAVNTDDQANHVTIRGTSPNYIQWKIEGVEVVNPNHLENSGTINDRPALNGGGVSMLSAQLLETSGFRFAPFLSGSNVLSGMFDLRFRNGNDKKMERTIQASFLGTDICLEGPFSKKGNASYLINFRYSTIGLLSKLGVNFGDEQTNYKDLSFVIALPIRRNTIKLFGMVGNSETVFKGPNDSALVTIRKELYDIDYHSFTALSGISVTSPLSNTVFLKTVMAYSSKNTRRSAYPKTDWLTVASEDDHYNQEKFSALSFVARRIGNHSRMKLGSGVNYFTTSVYSAINDIELVKGKLEEMLVLPFITFESALLKKIEMNVGLHGFINPRIDFMTLQPRASLKYHASRDQELEFSYGEDAQLQPAHLSLASSRNRNLKPTRSKSFSLSHQVTFKANTFKTEIYYQLFDQIPVNVFRGFSAFNYFNEFVNFDLESTGSAKVYGVDFTLEKMFKGFYIIPSVSIYNSLYTLKSNSYFTGRFNTGYNAVLTCGKEFTMEDKRRFISVDMRMVSRNGYLETSPSSGSNNYVFSGRLPSYFRLDFRLSYRKNRQRSTVIWALDIQNASNAKNIAYHYYDSFTKRIETRYQLGLIPVLSYKIMF